MLRTFTFLFFLFISITSQAQILISLLFGDALNTDKVEFGLIGGLNRSNFVGRDDASGLNNFNLGFYFHINLMEQSYLSTGVLVKSNVGATGMPVYALGDPQFDDLFKDGTLTTKISYFYVPIMWHQRFNNRWYIEGGIQTGLKHGAKDIFDTEFQDAELSFVVETKKNYYPMDFGFVGGAGYKFKKELKSMSAGIHYYYGVVDIVRDENISIRNSSLNFFIKIPIGGGGKKKTDEE